MPWRRAAYWLAPFGLLNLLSCTVEDQLPRDVTTYSGLGPPTLIINQENAPTGMPKNQS